jgi:methionyl-tRNA synthetase
MTDAVWITATPPTPNGALHVGHMAGPYIAADVLRRYLAAGGTSVLLTTGLDDYQSYVHVRGVREGRDPEDVADEFGQQIRRAWLDADIVFDRIGRPRTDDGYSEFVQHAFVQLYHAGIIVPRNRSLPYCASCERWLYEAYLVGYCPHCRARCNGNACETCGRPNECGDVVNPCCALCEHTAAVRLCERLYLPLAQFGDRLAAFWSKVDMPPHMRALCEVMLAAGLPEVAVSHPGEWGISVPLDGFRAHRIYVWFEMALGYLLEQEPTGKPPPVGPVQFFGFDNGYFHALLMPAVSLAYSPKAPLPRAFIVNEFYRLDGEKFSTSRNHAVWADEALREASADAVRLHVLSDRPTGRQTNFSRQHLRRSRHYLHTQWNGWLERLFTAVEHECQGVVPTNPPGGRGWSVLARRLTGILHELRDAYSVAGFDPRRAVALLDEVVACAVDFGYVYAHERSRPGGELSYRSALVAQLAVAAAFAAWSAPVVPAGASRLSSLLGIPADRPVDVEALAAPVPGTRLGNPAGPVFGALGYRDGSEEAR